MSNSNRLSRVILICFIAPVAALALWLLELSVSSQNAIPVVALQAEATVVSPTESQTVPPTNTPSPTPLPELAVEKNYNLIGDLNGNSKIDPGDTINYIIKVENKSNIEVSDVKISDDFDDKLLDQPSRISHNGMVKGGIIIWEFKQMTAKQEIILSYDVEVPLNFPSGRSMIKNTVAVESQGILLSTGEKNIEIEVTPTPTSSSTPVPPTLSLTPVPNTSTPALGPASQSAGPTGQAISPFAQAFLAFGFLLAAMGGLVSFAFLTLFEKEISTTLRDGYILTLIMGTVIILGLAGSVERSAIAGLIGTVAGYVLRGVVEGGRGKPV